MLLIKNSKSLIFLFNTQLIELEDKEPSAIIESLKNTWGDTALEPCLKQLIKLKDIKRILIVTDGDMEKPQVYLNSKPFNANQPIKRFQASS
jgi:hypothetical protein